MLLEAQIPHRHISHAKEGGSDLLFFLFCILYLLALCSTLYLIHKSISLIHTCRIVCEHELYLISHDVLFNFHPPKNPSIFF